MTKQNRPPITTPRPSRTNANAPHHQTTEIDANSILDFLYYDATRVGSILAQLKDEGVLTSVSETDQREHTSTSGMQGGLSTLISLGAQRATSGVDGHAFARTFDPYWLLPRLLLQELTERELLRRSIRTAKIGQIVEIRGDVEIVDPTSLGSAVDEIFASAGDMATEAEERFGATMVAQFVKMFPRATMGRVKSGNTEAWLNVAAGALVMSIDQIMLCHGKNMQGEWTVVGIVDALPDPRGGPIGPAPISDEKGDAAQHLIDFVQEINAAVHPFAGRKPRQFGVTPLLIYRQVS